MALLLRTGELPTEPTNIHFAVDDAAPTTLLVTWIRDGDDLVLLGEAPVDDLEATHEMLVKLNLPRHRPGAREREEECAAQGGQP